MTHTVLINNVSVKASFGCYHPEQRENTCPTGSGDCAACQYCKATMQAVDLLKAIKKED